MKPLNQNEIETLAEHLRSFRTAQLQKISGSEKGLGLGFYQSGTNFWIWIDMTAHCPVLLFFEDHPPRHKKHLKPVALFLKSNAVGHRLIDVSSGKEKGRVLSMTFGSADGKKVLCQMEIRLFPHGQNVIVESEGKSISWHKVKESSKQVTTVSEPKQERSLDEIKDQWIGGKSTKNKGSGGARKSLEKELKKKQRARDKLDSELQRKQALEWLEVGQWIQENVSLSVPEQWAEYIDGELSLGENIQTCFAKGKQNQEKIKGGKKRLLDLDKEITLLEESLKEGRFEQKNLIQSANLLQTASIKARRYPLAEDLVLYMGKSAKDNLAILRKAKAWDIWLHLKDVPGCHAIIRRDKKREVTEKELHAAGQWILENNARAQREFGPGQPYEFLVTEVRFVRPIKGDKLGRVRYSNEKVISGRTKE
jgi:predicted ribosome quality control (RQC) complex YloA/Tae2 family protein